MISAGDLQYIYDGRGNLSQIIEGENLTEFTFDAADRLRLLSSPNMDNVSYNYDANGRRVKQIIGIQETNYLWDGFSNCCNACDNVVLETNADGIPSVSYTLGGGKLLSQNRGGVVSYYLQDGQGNVRGLSDSAGNITDLYTYNAYGELESSQGTTPNSYMYNSQQYDELTGLYYLRARYYDPAISRFLSRDPIGYLLNNPSELNRYVYAHADPINFSDPSGTTAITQRAMFHVTITEKEKAIAAVVGAVTACMYAKALSRVCAYSRNGYCLLLLMSMVPPVCRLPICIFPGFVLWDVGDHMQDAQDFFRPMLLHYDKNKSVRNRRRREAGCIPKPIPPNNIDNSCDEYPFASSIEGGFGSSTRMLPWWQNRLQGLWLAGCIRGNLLRDGSEYAVIVIPQYFGPRLGGWYERNLP